MRWRRTCILVSYVDLVLISLNDLYYSFCSKDKAFFLDIFCSGTRNLLIVRIFKLCRRLLQNSEVRRDPVFGVHSAFYNKTDLHLLLSQIDIGYNFVGVPLTMNVAALSLPSVAGTVSLVDILPPAERALILDPTAMLAADSSLFTDRFSMAGVTDQAHAELALEGWRRGMMVFRTSVKAVNGEFSVRKDVTAQRLIIDARPANSRFKPPPHVKLPTPDVLARLRLQSGRKYFISKIDVENYYYRLRLPEWMWEYFALPPIHSSLIPGWDGPVGLVYPCMCVMPAGWSWAVFLSEVGHLNFLLKDCQVPPSSLVTPDTIDFLVEEERTAVYVDDNMAVSPDDHSASFDRLLSRYEEAGLTPKLSKVVRPTSDPVVCLGLEIDPVLHTISLAPKKLVALINVTRAVIQRGFCTGDQLSTLVGKWTWPCLACRPSLASFQAVYRFAACAGKRVFRLWRSVVRELRLLIGIAPLLISTLSDTWFKKVVATDASSSGLGVVASDFSGCVGFPTEVRWSTIVSSRWRFPGEHINSLELRSLLLAVRWVLSHKVVDCRVLMFSDSRVVVDAVRKGRSSSFALLRVMRSLSALLLVSGLRLELSWIPSELNPADGPSRL